MDPVTGSFFRLAVENALLYPMMELAGPRVERIEDVLYHYIVTPTSNSEAAHGYDGALALAVLPLLGANAGARVAIAAAPLHHLPLTRHAIDRVIR